MEKKTLRKSNDKIICGVCGGIADFFNIDSTIIRLLFVILTVFSGAGIVIYIVATIVMPTAADNSYASDDDVEKLKSANLDEDSSVKDKKNKSSGEKEVPHTDDEFNDFFKK